MQILVQRRGDCMFHRRLYAMGGQTSARPLTEALGSAAPVPGVAGEVRGPGTRTHSADCAFTESGTLPMFAVRMMLLLVVRMMLARRNRRCARHPRQQ
jgi:hypothetical protein